MSLESWKKEFYPIEAFNATGSDVEACEHSLRKWKGALEENLKKHGLRKLNDRVVIEDSLNRFTFGCHDCALCQRFDPDNGGQNPDCSKCPLAIVRGDVDCASAMTGEEHPPYRRFRVMNDPRLMIDWLKKALIWAKKNERGAKK